MNHINEMIQYLADVGLEYTKLDYYFPKHDARVWGLIIDPNNTKLIVFCKVNHLDINTVTFDVIASAGTYYNIGNEFVIDKINQLALK